MNQHSRKQFLAELGNIFIQFQIEMMQKEKMVRATKQEKRTGKDGAVASRDKKKKATAST